MIIVRDRHTRGKMTTGLVDARYTFSFGDYRDPDHIVRLNGDELREGDGARIFDESFVELDTDHRGEFLLFDLR